MKRIGICILIGIGCSFIIYGLMKIWKNTLSYQYANLPSYQGELTIQVGDISDNEKAISNTLHQIQNRLLDIKSKQIDKNHFSLSVQEALDTTSTKELLFGSVELRFLETYSILDIQKELAELDKELNDRKKQASDTADKYAFLSEPDNNEGKKKQGVIALTDLIKFYSPYQGANGSVRCPAALGNVKTSDTAYLDSVLNERKIKEKFPADLFFAYEKLNKDIKMKDQGLDLYAIKIPDQKLYPCPTGDNISNCQQDFDPVAGGPIITLEFDPRGSSYWFNMTQKNIGKPIAIMANDLVLTAPAPESGIKGGKSKITGNFSIEEARNLAAMIRTGKLELPVTILKSEFKPAKPYFPEFWLLSIVFLVTTSIACGVSFLIKPASKP